MSLFHKVSVPAAGTRVHGHGMKCTAHCVVGRTAWTILLWTSFEAALAGGLQRGAGPVSLQKPREWTLLGSRPPTALQGGFCQHLSPPGPDLQTPWFSDA